MGLLIIFPAIWLGMGEATFRESALWLLLLAVVSTLAAIAFAGTANLDPERLIGYVVTHTIGLAIWFGLGRLIRRFRRRRAAKSALLHPDA